MIERKRQETLEMCRIFEDETERNKQRSIGLRNKRSVSDEVDNAGVDESAVHDESSEVDNTVVGMDNNAKAQLIGKVDQFDNKIETDDKTTEYLNADELGGKVSADQSDTPGGFAPNMLEAASGSEEASTTATTDAVGDVTQSDDPQQTKKNMFRYWKKGVVPYYIDSKTYDSELGERIQNAFIQFEKLTCIRLQRMRRYPSDTESTRNADWVYITNPAGIKQCVHSNEKKVIRGVQVVVFGYDCMSVGDIQHEIMHVLGFAHEHTRPDRDNHVKILWENIKPGYSKFFKKRRLNPNSSLNSLPYDHSSLLHYPPRAFSKNGKSTIVPLQEDMKIGQRDGLSETDMLKVKLSYEDECMARNRHYLEATCPSVIKTKLEPFEVTEDQIKDYFKHRIWKMGVVSYTYKTPNEFTTEENNFIKNAIRHIEKETCITFNDLTSSSDKEVDDNEDDFNKASESDKKEQSDKSTTNETVTDDKGNQTHKAESDKENATSKESNTTLSPTTRRHLDSILTLTRSNTTRCICPEPGKSDKEVLLGDDCFNTVNDLLHVLVHVLGMDHQHDSYDRDAYLLIDWDDLATKTELTTKQKLPPAASLGFPYDYHSVMHFPWLQIDKGVTNTMYPIWNDGWAMGNWKGLSPIDVQKLNTLYQDECSKHPKIIQLSPHSVSNVIQ